MTETGQMVAILDRSYRIGDRLPAYDITALVREAPDGMEEFVGELEEYCLRLFPDGEEEPDRCRLELVLRWEACGICCPHGPARIIVERDACSECQRMLQRSGARRVMVEVVEFHPAAPPEGHYCGYCHEGVAFLVVGE
jgi:hypothetical protein